MVFASPVASIAAFGALIGLPLALASAQAQTPPPSSPPVATDAAKPAEPELTAEEKKEKEMRRACKVALCTAFHVRKPPAGEITCNVMKSWRKEQIVKMIGRGGITWPYGAARCQTDLKFNRETLIKAVSEPEYEAQFDRHDIKCEIERATDKYEMKVEIAPKVTFKDGRAVKATMNWGKIDAPTLAKGALWSATAADNSLGVLQKTVVEDINDFIGAKCLEVKDEWTAK